jgi:hypothetical protein
MRLKTMFSKGEVVGRGLDYPTTYKAVFEEIL